MFAKADLSDPEIVASLTKGDKEAFHCLYNKYVSLLLNYGMSFTQNKELVKDCVHDLYTTIWQRRENLGNIESMQAYLLTSMRRQVILRLKQQEKGEQRDRVFSLGIVENDTAEDQLVRTEEQQQTRKWMLEKLEALPARQREAIFLRFFAGIEYNEMATLMNLNYQGVRNLVYKAVNTLRSALTENNNGIILLLAFLLCQ